MRLVFAISVIYDWRRPLNDAENVFTCTAVEENFSFEQPKELGLFVLEKYVRSLNKALFRLEQASDECQFCLNSFPAETGCARSNADPALTLLNRNDFFVVSAVYVDDVMLISNKQTIVSTAIEEVRTALEIRVSKTLCTVHDTLYLPLSSNVSLSSRLATTLHLFRKYSHQADFLLSLYSATLCLRPSEEPAHVKPVITLRQLCRRRMSNNTVFVSEMLVWGASMQA